MHSSHKATPFEVRTLLTWKGRQSLKRPHLSGIRYFSEFSLVQGLTFTFRNVIFISRTETALPLSRFVGGN